MSTTYYVDSNGDQLGGFGPGAVIPAGATEVPAPAHGRDTWDFDNSVYIPYAGIEADAAAAALEASDADMARVGEDLIDVLVTRGVIELTDFDPSVVTKLNNRKINRGKL